MLVERAGGVQSGCGVHPARPGIPNERLSAILEDARPIMVLSHHAVVAEWDAAGVRVVCLEDVRPQIALESKLAPESGVGPGDLLYVIFTSGSTGRPKGVRIRMALWSTSSARSPQAGHEPNERLLAVTTLSFDIAGAGAVLAAGCRRHESSSPTREPAMVDRLRALLTLDVGITVMQATPATWRLLLSRGGPEIGRAEGAVRRRGAACRARRRIARPRWRKLWNMYGPTETTIWSLGDYSLETGAGPSPVGRPIGNTRSMCPAANRSSRPVGFPANCSSAVTAWPTGYLEAADLTAEKFVGKPVLATKHRHRTAVPHR